MKRKILVKQQNSSDCGAACLTSVAAHYKLFLSISQLRAHAGTRLTGTPVIGLIKAAELIGFIARGVKSSVQGLKNAELPTIAHILSPAKHFHFVVIYGMTSGTIKYMDPSDGTMKNMPWEDFEKLWTGVLILLKPGKHFVSGNRKIPSLNRFLYLLNPHKRALFYAAFAAILYTILGLSGSMYLQIIIDRVLTGKNIKLLNELSLLMLLILFLQICMAQIKSTRMLRFGQQIDFTLITGYFHHILKLPKRFHDNMRIGEILSRVNDAIKIRTFINETALNIIVSVLILLFSSCAMFFYYWKLAAILLILIPIYAIIYFKSNQINKKWQRRVMENDAAVESHMVESLNTLLSIKQLGLENHASCKMNVLFKNLLQSVFAVSSKNMLITNVSDFFTKLFTIIVLWSGSYFVIQRQLTTGELLSFYALMSYFSVPAMVLINANRNIQDVFIASDRLFEMMDLSTDEDVSGIGATSHRLVS